MIDGIVRILGFPVQLWLKVFAILLFAAVDQSLFVCSSVYLLSSMFSFVKFVSLLVCSFLLSPHS